MDELENELGDEITFIRLNIQEEVGRELAPIYDFEFTPTFIYFDEQGNEVWREVGGLDTQHVRESVE